MPDEKMIDLLSHDDKLLEEVEGTQPEAEPEETVAGDRQKIEVDSGALILEVESFFSRFIVLPPGMPLVLALWTACTHLFDSFDCFPYLSVTSPTKQCGKTRATEVLELVCAEPVRASNLSEPVMFRLVEKMQPTLVIDESEGLRNPKSERAQILVGLLNAGHRKGAVVYRCHGQNHDVRPFRIYCPKVLVAIGDVPDTVRDRSITLHLQRKKPGDKIQRFLFKEVQVPATNLKERLSELVMSHVETIEEVYRTYTIDFLEDREAENWTPLFCICSVFAPGRLADLKETALRATKQKAGLDADDSLSMRLLADLQSIIGDGGPESLFGEKKQAIASADLVARLRGIEEAPWEESNLSARRLARLLKHFEVQPRQVWDAGRNVRGYQLDDFPPLFSRYPGIIR